MSCSCPLKRIGLACITTLLLLLSKPNVVKGFYSSPSWPSLDISSKPRIRHIDHGVLYSSNNIESSSVILFSSSSSNNDNDKEVSSKTKTTPTRKKRKKKPLSNDTTPDPDNSNQPLTTPLPGGSNLLFSMARRMLLWEDRPSINDASSAHNKKLVLPRWHPHRGVSDVNPSFRSSSPKMNAVGYAGAIRRNSRKRQTALQRNALRIYDRLGDGGDRGGVAKVRDHYEAALVSCAKLGLWKEARAILDEVESECAKREFSVDDDRVVSNSREGKIVRKSLHRTVVTNAMVLSVIKACVRASKKQHYTLSIEEKREPLDVAKDILFSVQEKHKIPITSIHITPIASAYQRLNLYSEAESLIQSFLQNTTTSTHIFDDAAPAHSLLVKGAVSNHDWAKAVQELKNMTHAGMIPNSRDLNSWTESS